MTGVVLDTNVVVSASLNEQGLEASVLLLTFSGQLSLFVSEPILTEYAGVLHRKKFPLDPDRVDATLNQISKVSTLVQPTRTLSIASHPADNRFLECAEAAAADYLVTGNKRHFPKAWGKTRVVNARELLDLIKVQLPKS
jgi:uncharacterized protein